jgi:nicotinamide mononucleotide transporter
MKTNFANRIIEILAVVLNLLFTWLYAQGNAWCFLVGVLSPLLYLYITYQRKIYADAFLQIFYAVTTLWGFFRMANDWHEVELSPSHHFIILSLVFVCTGISGRILKVRTDAALPTLDSFITCLAIAGTVLMMWPVHACWLYLLAVNVLSILLYFHRGLYISCGMFGLYIIMCVDAYWRLGWLS